MSGAIPPLPNTSSWRSAQLKKAQGQLYLYLYSLGKNMYFPEKFRSVCHHQTKSDHVHDTSDCDGLRNTILRY
jgi:hypothetical protein